MVLVLVSVPVPPWIPHNELGRDGGASEVTGAVEGVEHGLVVPREERGGGGQASPR